MKDLAKFYKRVVEWNQRAGVKDHTYDTADWWKAVELQTKLLVEESTEAYNASIYGDKTELLDGAIDNLVIAFKFVDMLDKAGYDVLGAFEAVCSNNDMKIFDSFYEACECKEALEKRDDQEYTIETSVENGLPYYTVRRFDMKIAKPVNFVSVDLSTFIPK